MNDRYDVAVIGSGFAGSILAWVLASQGRHVALIDKAKHPRFAIGESSTPLADLLLRRLAQQYDLPTLDGLSTFGNWQRQCPQLACGKKRGFSYYQHSRDTAFHDTEDHQRSLLVAASQSDELADTHWYRSEVDEFLFDQAIESGAADLTGLAVSQVFPGESKSETSCLELAGGNRISADYLIDASGRSAVVPGLLSKPDRSEKLLTQTYSTFAHFEGVRSWSRRFGSEHDPFDGDAAAQHHLVEDGWMWMLRMNNGITSVGTTSALASPLRSTPNGYPSIDWMMENTTRVTADVEAGRLQRLYDPIVGPRCWLLPTAAATIDPLHSTGIAHALAGVERTARIILQPCDVTAEYRDCFNSEVALLDDLISTAYATMREFSRFTATCMLYFAGAIACEETFAQGDSPASLWGADDAVLVSTLRNCCDLLRSGRPTSQVIDQIRTSIAPWNTAGLLDQTVNNRYAYTAAAK